MTHKARVLFVDDEVRIVRMLSIMFRHRYEVMTATSGAEALELIKKEQPHVVVSDQRMPKMTGIELLSEVRKVSPKTVRILLTGYSDLIAVIGAVNDGEVYRFLNKPWNEAELTEAIDGAIKIAIDGMVPDTVSQNLANDVDLSPLANAAKLLTIGKTDRERRELVELFTEDYNILTENNVSDALKTLSQHDVGVVVAEYESTSEEAIDLCTRVREMSPATTVVLIAGSTDSGTVVRLINEGHLYRFAMKPISPNVFRLAVGAAMREHHRRMALEYYKKARRENTSSPDSGTELLEGTSIFDDIKNSLSRFTQVW